MTDQRGVAANSSRIQLDGALTGIPGFQAGAYKLDQGPWFTLNNLLTNLFGGASGNLAHFLAPCNYTVVAAYTNVTVAPGTGPATIGIGTTGDTDKYLDDYSVGTSHATGFTNLTDNVAFTAPASGSLNGSQGDLIVFQTDGGGTATGLAVWGCVVVPR